VFQGVKSLAVFPFFECSGSSYLFSKKDLAKLPATAKEAKESGAKYYFTGKACPQGHIVPRHTTSYGCVTCQRDARKRSRLKGGDREERYRQTQLKKNRAKYAQSKAHREKVRGEGFKRMYGITLKEYERLLISQKGKCNICGIHESFEVKRLAVDHSHDSGKVRGLLCQKCNLMLGKFDENLDKLSQAAKYLESNKDYRLVKLED
jgi:hypothetical protein